MDLWWIELWCLAHTAFFPVVLSNSCSTYDTMTGDVVRRSSAYILAPTDTAICDNFLDEKWYRLDSLAGNDIVQTCPPVTHCGTVYPLWMNGTLPMVSEGEVDRTVCQSGLAGCCESPFTIQVRNCGTFNVYYLRRTSGCPIAYCFGTQLVNQSEVTQESTDQTTEVGTSDKSEVTQESTEQTTEVGTSGTQLVNQSEVTQESTEQTPEVGTSDNSATGMNRLWIVLVITFLAILAILAAFYVWNHKYTKPGMNGNSLNALQQTSNTEEETDNYTSTTEMQESSSIAFDSDEEIESEEADVEDMENPEPMGMRQRETTDVTITDVTITDNEAALPYTDMVLRGGRIAK